MSATLASSGREAGLSSRVFLGHVHPGDVGVRGPVTAPLDEIVDRVRRTFGDDLDPSVVEVARPPRQPKALSLSPARVSEEDALDVPRHDDPPPVVRHR